MNRKFWTPALRMLALGAVALTASPAARADWYRQDGRADEERSRIFAQQIDARQHAQRARIENGRRTGSLTRGEFHDLMRQQQEIRAMRRHFEADGRMGPREYERLDEALDRAARTIRAQKHDAQDRYAYGRWSARN